MYSDAINWYSTAGDARGMTDLGVMYANGQDDNPDVFKLPFPDLSSRFGQLDVDLSCGQRNAEEKEDNK